jgi:hypothetical protein
VIAHVLQDSAVGVKGVTCVLNCLMHICEKDVSLFYFIVHILSWFRVASSVGKYFDYLTEIGSHIVSLSVHF